jgi:hypothetical protein
MLRRFEQSAASYSLLDRYWVHVITTDLGETLREVKEIEMNNSELHMWIEESVFHLSWVAISECKQDITLLGLMKQLDEWKTKKHAPGLHLFVCFLYFRYFPMHVWIQVLDFEQQTRIVHIAGSSSCLPIRVYVWCRDAHKAASWWRCGRKRFACRPLSHSQLVGQQM